MTPRARPTVTERIKVRISATRVTEREITRYVDATMIDRMHHAGQLSDRQHAAGARLYALYRHAGLEPRSTARYDVLREAVEDDGEVETAQEPDEARAAYNALLRRSGPLFGGLLAGMMGHTHPGVRWLATAQEALDWLGDEWGMDR